METPRGAQPLGDAQVRAAVPACVGLPPIVIDWQFPYAVTPPTRSPLLSRHGASCAHRVGVGCVLQLGACVCTRVMADRAPTAYAQLESLYYEGDGDADFDPDMAAAYAHAAALTVSSAVHCDWDLPMSSLFLSWKLRIPAPGQAGVGGALLVIAFIGQLRAIRRRAHALKVSTEVVRRRQKQTLVFGAALLYLAAGACVFRFTDPGHFNTLSQATCVISTMVVRALVWLRFTDAF
jgi:hypothetical protein